MTTPDHAAIARYATDEIFTIHVESGLTGRCEDIDAIILSAITAATEQGRKDSERWLAINEGAESCKSAIAIFQGVEGPNIGFIINRRFFPYGSCGSLPYTHWMPIPEEPDAARQQEKTT